MHALLGGSHGVESVRQRAETVDRGEAIGVNVDITRPRFGCAGSLDLFQLLYVLAIVTFLRVEAQGLKDLRAVVGMILIIGLAAATHPIGYVLLPVAVVFFVATAAADGALNRRTAGRIAVAVGLTILV